MFKKQIQKFQKTFKISALFLILLTVLIGQFLVLTPTSTVEAQSSFCTYQMIDNGGGSTAGNQRNGQVSMTYSGIKNPQDSMVGIEGKVTVTYTATTQSGGVYQNAESCAVKGFVEVVSKPGPLGGVSTYSSKVYLENQTIKVVGNSIQLEGTYRIPNFADSLSNSFAIRNSTTNQSETYFLRYGGTENGQSFYPAGLTGSISFPLVVCPNDKTNICTGSSGDVIIGDGQFTAKLDDVKLDIAAIASTAAGPNYQEIIPKDKRGTEANGEPKLQNFFRIYKEGNQSFGFGARVTPKAPVNTFLQKGKTKFSFSDETISPKSLSEVFAGIYNPALSKEANANGIGCYKDTYDAANVKKFAACVLEPRDSTGPIDPVKMDGSTHILLGMNFSYTNLEKMFVTVKEVSCKKTDGKIECPPETKENANLVQLIPGLSMDASLWSDTSYQDIILNKGLIFGPLGGIGASIFSSLVSKYNGVPVAFNNGKYPVYIIVYNTKEEWEANKDKETPDWVPTPTAVTATSSLKPTTGNSLYEFIVKVISVVVTWLQSIIYRIFAFVLVPIINALLQVRPYKDAFVNVIYPGWLILRNLANIFFIISLLVVGLRILFQQSGSSTAVTFIRRLLIMALLVNFSLVIAQGIIGIADTVQSQFLPANTKVIEALGLKLMVEPLQNFRAEVTGESSDYSTSDAETGLSDTVKPIVLLILSVASFFAFAAIAAFLLVRLVMLWILYMLSPIAYVLYVMDETRQYANQWWSEFTKWAIITPLLVFFLNIGALMAVSFSTGSKNLEIFNKGQTFTGDVVIGSLTIISHFVVLAFIFGGMMFATKLGGKAGKTIVDYAKKGFKNTFKKPVQWAGSAKDAASGYASGKLDDANYKGAARALDAFSHPLQFGAAVKKRWIDDPGKKRKEAVAERLGDTFLTRPKLKGDPLKGVKAYSKEKGHTDLDDSVQREMLLSKSLKEKKQKDGQAAILELTKNGEFDEIVRSAENQYGKTYSKDSAGINAAIDDMQKDLGFSDVQKEAFQRNVHSRAKKDSDKAHYSGGVKLDKDGKYVPLKADSSFEKDATGNPKVVDGKEVKAGKFEKDDAKKWEKDQVDRRVKKGLREDIASSGDDAKVVFNADKSIAGFTQTQVGVFAESNLNNMDDKAFKTIKNGKNFEVMQKGYDSYFKEGDLSVEDGKDRIKDAMKRFNRTHYEGDELAKRNAEVNRKVEIMHTKLFNKKTDESDENEDSNKKGKDGKNKKNKKKPDGSDDNGGNNGPGEDGGEPVNEPENPPVSPSGGAGPAGVDASDENVDRTAAAGRGLQLGTGGTGPETTTSADTPQTETSTQSVSGDQTDLSSYAGKSFTVAGDSVSTNTPNTPSQIQKPTKTISTTTVVSGNEFAPTSTKMANSPQVNNEVMNPLKMSKVQQQVINSQPNLEAKESRISSQMSSNDQPDNSKQIKTQISTTRAPIATTQAPNYLQEDNAYKVETPLTMGKSIQIDQPRDVSAKSPQSSLDIDKKDGNFETFTAVNPDRELPKVSIPKIDKPTDVEPPKFTPPQQDENKNENSL